MSPRLPNLLNPQRQPRRARLAVDPALTRAFATTALFGGACAATVDDHANRLDH